MKHSILFVLLAIAATSEAVAVENSAWRVTLGGGTYFRPEFPGSESNEMRPLPVLDITYADRWFLRSGDGLGGYLWRSPSWTTSLSVAPDLLRRRENDDTRLDGLGNVSETARALLSTSYGAGAFKIKATVASDIGGQGHGTTATVELELSRALMPRWWLRASMGANWTNAQFMRTFFGVDSVQSARSGLPTFTPSSGIVSGNATLATTYDFLPHWRLGAQAQLGKWFGDAADSPVVEQQSFNSFSAFVAYTF